MKSKARGPNPKIAELPMLDTRAFPALPTNPEPNPNPPAITHPIATDSRIDEDTAMAIEGDTNQISPHPEHVEKNVNSEPDRDPQDAIHNPPASVPPNGTRESITDAHNTQFTVVFPKPSTYANALKRTAGQVESDSGEDPSDDQPVSPDDPGNGEEDGHRETIRRPPGPIKGFNTERILKNLDPVVRDSWEGQMDEAVFVHYLGSGYDPNIAQNVHMINEDLKSKQLPK